ncbi:aldo/keto reductase [Pseudodesulfovibrio sp. zrk46]|uniref:aldo/keto reductase n=1 Tax=Pseudodesulfovibrio sp. zrk46 TaxID=2725288 RepID=UPI001449358B|nr:aldo/keto reductase [Pseudodesulfovibrio sp. zrk46]QJB56758.1 aldo/keto reductase [Pseudodesulfovibrio sp. zrk46]
MLYRKVPKNGDELSILGFGAMRLPVNEDQSINEEKAIEQMRRAIDAGVNYLDTAWPYHGGMSEIVLGKALKDGYREKVKIADKLPVWLCKSREDMDAILDKQLAKLDVDCIDYYLLHALEGEAWDRIEALGVIDFLEDAKAAGKIANIGFSFHGANEDFSRIVDAYDWTFCQIQYNFLDTENQAGTAGLKHAASKDIAVIIMEPLRGGNLSRPEAPPQVAALWDTAETKRAPVEWALRWVWNAPEVTVVLSGMNVDEHIDQNLAIAAEAEADSLTDGELELISKVADKYIELMPVGCTGCQYCMPCPAGVNIPGCFELYNTGNMFEEPQQVTQFRYAAFSGGAISGKPRKASQCVECGQCVEHCPQHIDIPERLKEVAEYCEVDGIDDAAKNFLKGDQSH